MISVICESSANLPLSLNARIKELAISSKLSSLELNQLVKLSAKYVKDELAGIDDTITLNDLTNIMSLCNTVMTQLVDKFKNNIDTQFRYTDELRSIINDYSELIRRYQNESS